MIEPVFGREPTPDHAPDFWSRLDAKLHDDARPFESHEPTRRLDVTASMPGSMLESTAGSGPDPQRGGEPEGSPLNRRRRAPVLAAAAALLAVVGIGAVALSLSRPDQNQQVVVAESDGAFLGQGGDGPNDSEDASQSAEADETDQHAGLQVQADTAPVSDAAEQSGSEDTIDASALPPLLGNGDSEIWLPRDDLAEGTLGDGYYFLATWEEQKLSWFAVPQPGTDCHDLRHVEIVRVNSSGIPLAVADPQPTFSGKISLFSVSDNQRRVAFVADCDGQLELYAARLSPEAGRLYDQQLVWAGTGSTTAALIQWDGSLLSFHSIDNAIPFFVDVDLEAQTVTGIGAVSDAPPGLDTMMVGATPDGSLTWWNVDAPSGSAACDGKELVVRGSDGVFRPASLEDATAGITVAIGGGGELAVEPDSSQVAFSNECPGINTAAVRIGTLRADGLISSLRTIDLSVYATGQVVELHWFDPNTLRIHIDSSNTGGTVQRFDWVFDAGRDAGFLQAVD